MLRKNPQHSSKDLNSMEIDPLTHDDIETLSVDGFGNPP